MTTDKNQTVEPISNRRLLSLTARPMEFTPRTKGEMQAALSVPLWRLSHLYKIIVKGEDDSGDDLDMVMTFKPNRAQRKVIRRLWYRNLILKARQLGFTTFITILFLDYSLFGRGNTRAGIIAHTENSAKTIFRDKVKFAYTHLPPELLALFPLERDSADELLFAHNNSSIRVSTSMRSGTINYLHVSEFGKICAFYPIRAAEVITGSIPAVPKSGMVFIESTAEGQEGEFYKMSLRSQKLYEAGVKLNRKQYQFHFFAWWEAPEYRMPAGSCVITQEEHDYFDQVEQKVGTTLDIEQRTWWIVTRDEDFSGSEETMWQEYPSFPEEAFQVSLEGTYFAKQFQQARKGKRIIETLPAVPGVPCWTFWDIGNSDGTAIWVMQKVGTEFRLIDYYEAWGEPYSHAAQWLQSRGYTYSTHYLPHDADHQRQGSTMNESPKEMLEALMPGHDFEIVPRIEDINWGIQQTRNVFPMLYFNVECCKEGIRHLELYRKKWNAKQERWSEQPDKAHGHSEAADALRQFAQAYHNGQLNIYKARRSKKPRRAGGMAV